MLLAGWTGITRKPTSRRSQNLLRNVLSAQISNIVRGQVTLSTLDEIRVLPPGI